MGFKSINYLQKELTLHKSIVEPHFDSKIVLTEDTWEYVEMWLKRQRKNEALFFWRQAKSFYNASILLPRYSAPLTAYYAILNSAKSLLIVKGVPFSDCHGVNGENKEKRVSLSNEIIRFNSRGVLPGLCQYLGELSTPCKYTLKDVLYNLPCIHRSYNLTFKSRPNLFIPVEKPIFVKKDFSTESWFCANIANQKYANCKTLKTLPECFEKDESINDKFIIRSRNRFKWNKGDKKGNLIRLRNYHKKIRKHLMYINGPTCLWYIKRAGNTKGIIDRSPLTLRFVAMHRLSELARYSPALLSRHFRSKHNWLLLEFIKKSLNQYIDEISAEITGTQVLVPGIRSK